MLWKFPSPYLGLSLKFKDMPLQLVEFDGFPSPNLGLYLKLAWKALKLSEKETFRPLNWGYLWNKSMVTLSRKTSRFRPLIWGYLWNMTMEKIWCGRDWFPSPYLGLYLKYWWPRCPLRRLVSVPLFGAISEIRLGGGWYEKAVNFRPLIWGYLWNVVFCWFVRQLSVSVP